jgi:hypothetical protein
MSGYASLTDQKREFIGELASDLADAVKRHWLTDDTSSDWERLVREQQQAAAIPKVEPAKGSDSNAPPAVAPINDATPLALRGRFKEFVGLEFTSEVLRQIQSQLESRDDRGRPVILARDAKLIADTARVAVSSLAMHIQQGRRSSQFTESSLLRPLIAACSRRVLSQRVENFDPRQPDNFLPSGAVDELLQIEARSLLEESLTRLEFSEAIAALVDLDQATSRMHAHAIANTQQYGSERRTLLLVPICDSQHEATERLQVALPLATVVPAGVDDVLVVSEEAGVSPQALAHGLECAFPGVAEAARRLHTRIDVNWQSLL